MFLLVKTSSVFATDFAAKNPQKPLIFPTFFRTETKNKCLTDVFVFEWTMKLTPHCN